MKLILLASLDHRSSIPGRGRDLLSSPLHTDRLRDPPNLLSNVYRGLFLWGKAAGA
jgi:hypothetical protein